MRYFLSFLCVFSLFAEGTHILELKNGPLTYTSELGSIPVKDKVEILAV